MDNVSKILRDHYEKAFLQYGANSKGVDWGENEERQHLRYDNMLSVIGNINTEAPSILDIGCGYGGLLDYANRKGVALHYTGIDIVKNMILWARDAFPNATFIVGDIFETNIENHFDYVVCNGILTLKTRCARACYGPLCK